METKNKKPKPSLSFFKTDDFGMRWDGGLASRIAGNRPYHLTRTYFQTNSRPLEWRIGNRPVSQPRGRWFENRSVTQVAFWKTAFKMPRSTTCTVADFCSFSLAACPSKHCSNTTGCTNQKLSICVSRWRTGHISDVDSWQCRQCGRPWWPHLFLSEVRTALVAVPIPSDSIKFPHIQKKTKTGFLPICCGACVLKA